jgi:hypothetical protein
MSDEELVRQLIADVKAKVAPRAALLETRIEKALHYVGQVKTPNAHTLRHIRLYLSGGYDELAVHSPAKVLRDLFERRWRCGVTASGYHNGAGCSPGDPHDGWGCGYRWMAPALTEAEAREMGLLNEEGTKET